MKKLEDYTEEELIALFDKSFERIMKAEKITIKNSRIFVHCANGTILEV